MASDGAGAGGLAGNAAGRGPDAAAGAGLSAPALTLTELLETDGLERQVALARFIATADPVALLELYGELDGRRECSLYASDAIFLRWTALDPEGAMEFAREEGRPTSAIWAWAKNDPEAALAYGLEHDLAPNVIRAVAQGDPERGKALLEQHPELDGRIVWEGITNGLSSREHRREAAIFAYEKGVDDDGSLRRWALSDPDGALAFARGQPDLTQRSKAVGKAIAAVAETDPAAALTAARDLPAGDVRAGAMTSLLGDLARTDPEAAAAAALGSNSPIERDLALLAVTAATASSDPELAFGLLDEVSVERVLQFADGLSFHWDSGSGSTSRIVRGSPDLREVARRMAAVDPARTLSFIAAQPSSSDIDGFASELTTQWVWEAPEDASRWVADLPQGERRDQSVVAMANAITSGGMQDFEGALAWLQTLTSGSRHYDHAAVQLFDRWSESDPEAAIQAMEDLAAGGGAPPGTTPGGAGR